MCHIRLHQSHHLTQVQLKQKVLEGLKSSLRVTMDLPFKNTYIGEGKQRRCSGRVDPSSVMHASFHLSHHYHSAIELPVSPIRKPKNLQNSLSDPCSQTVDQKMGKKGRALPRRRVHAGFGLCMW